MIHEIIIGSFLILVGIVGSAAVLLPRRNTNPVFLGIARLAGTGGAIAIVLTSCLIAFFSAS